MSSIRIGLRTLGANKLRTALSTLGVVIGVAALVAVLSVGDGVEKFARDQIERNSDLQTVAVRARDSREMDGIRVPVENPVEFTPADMDGILAVAVGVVFGIYPALRAARLSPVDAIRHE